MDSHNFATGKNVARFPLTYQAKPDYCSSQYIHFKVTGKNDRIDLGLSFLR